MDSLDVDSIFTNIPLEETINVFTNWLHDNDDVIEFINKSEVKNILPLAIQESHFVLNDVLYTKKGWRGHEISPWIYYGKCFVVIL